MKGLIINMGNISLGITATELFACNPFRILGVPVNIPQKDIQAKYEKLLSMANAGTTSTYSTPFDFDSLPPIKRNPTTIKQAFAKLSSNGYRCFAYSDPQFPIALNIDDVALNLRDITCYDCFLRCYMWLVTNDRDFEEATLWIQLCSHIDKLIMSSPDNWRTYFDHRFPEDMIDAKLQIYKTFYTTFCEIILLPLKEMVRGSMKCTTATDIIKLKGIDVNEVFEEIEIPQANLPKRGQPAPLLKIAVKEIDELLTDEHNEFSAVTVAPISASEIFDDKPEKPAPAQKIASFADRVDTLLHKKPSEPAPSIAPKVVEPKPVVPQPVAVESPVAPADEAPAEDLISLKVPNSLNKPVAKPVTKSTLTVVEEAEEEPEIAEEAVQIQSKKAAPKKIKTRTSLIGGEDIPDETTDISLSSEDGEDDEDNDSNIYTDALIRMLRSNRVHNQQMKDVDTKRAYNNGDTGLDSGFDTPELVMDDINAKIRDESLLDSPYDLTNDEDMTREEKFKNVKIDDMLNPKLIGAEKSGSVDPVNEFLATKANFSKAARALIKLSFVIAGIVALIIALNILNIL